MSKITKINVENVEYDIGADYSNITNTPDLTQKQDKLISGTNIKTVNNQSLLGSGNITIESSASTDVQVNGSSITSNGVANIVTESAYNSSTNKIATMSDVPDTSGFITKDANNLTYYYTKTEIDGKVSSVYKYKGSVETYSNLPSSNLTVGDVYNVVEDDNNYAWNGTEWDKLGGDIDLSGYQTKIDSTHKLSADLVDDTGKTNKFVTASEKTTWNSKYEKPSGGIPKSDLDSSVQASLSKADTALQTEQYTGTYSKPSGGIPKTDLASAVQTSLGKADTALQSYTEQYTGTITGITMNGASKGTSGVVDLGTVITSHQDISGKQDKLVVGTNITIANDGKTISATDTTYSNATTSASGLMSATDKTKLNGIATGAEVNVQANWNETNSSSDAYIQNKPTIPTASSLFDSATLSIVYDDDTTATYNIAVFKSS